MTQPYARAPDSTSPICAIFSPSGDRPHSSGTGPTSCAFVARGYSADGKHLVELIKQALQHKGFALVDIFSPCVTFNKDNDYNFFKPRVKKLEDEGHDTSDWKTACEKAMLWDDTIYIGLFLKGNRPTIADEEPILDEGPPLAHRLPGITKEQSQRIIKRMM